MMDDPTTSGAADVRRRSLVASTSESPLAFPSPFTPHPALRLSDPSTPPTTKGLLPRWDVGTSPAESMASSTDEEAVLAGPQSEGLLLDYYYNALWFRSVA